MRQLSATDTVMLLQETGNAPNQFGPILICDPHTAAGERITFEDVLDGIEQRLHRVPIFRRRLVQSPWGLANPYWVEDPHFDLRFHIRHVALPGRGDWRQLATLIARLYAHPMDLSRPPWELYVIEGLDDVPGAAAGTVAVYLKLHHAAVDGQEALRLLGVLTSTDPAARIAPVTAEWSPDRLPSRWELLGRALRELPQRPVAGVGLIGKAIPALAKTAVRAVASGDVQVAIPWTRFSAQVTAHRSYESVLLDFEEVQRVRAAIPGATVNDVALATVGGAMRRYLFEHGELPDRTLSAAVPVSTRTERDGRGGNRIDTTAAVLGTDVDDDLERLRVIAESTTSIRTVRHGVGLSHVARLAEVIPAGLVGFGYRTALNLAAAAGITPVANTVVTNVPGPRMPLYFLGCEVTEMHGTGPILDGMGLIHLVASYRTDLIVSVLACRTMMPDPEFYAQCLRESFGALTKAA